MNPHKPFLLALAGSVLLCACDNTKNAELDLGSSSRYSAHELQMAADCVLEKFQDFESCDLTRLWYDEAFSDRRIAEDPNLTAGDSLILLSNFYVGLRGGNEGFNANSTYTDWSWTLTRNASGEWEVTNYGYG